MMIVKRCAVKKDASGGRTISILILFLGLISTVLLFPDSSDTAWTSFICRDAEDIASYAVDQLTKNDELGDICLDWFDMFTLRESGPDYYLIDMDMRIRFVPLESAAVYSVSVHLRKESRDFYGGFSYRVLESPSGFSGNTMKVRTVFRHTDQTREKMDWVLQTLGMDMEALESLKIRTLTIFETEDNYEIEEEYVQDDPGWVQIPSYYSISKDTGQIFYDAPDDGWEEY